jgi:hypothetical protein
MKRIPNFKIVEGDPNLIRDEILIETDKSTGNIADIKKRVNGKLVSIIGNNGSTFINPTEFRVVPYSNTSPGSFFIGPQYYPGPFKVEGIGILPYVINITEFSFSPQTFGIVSFVTSDYKYTEGSTTDYPKDPYLWEVGIVDESNHIEVMKQFNYDVNEEDHMFIIPIDILFYEYYMKVLLGDRESQLKVFDHAIVINVSGKS